MPSMLGAHLDQAFGDIADFRLGRGILDDGVAMRQHRGHEGRMGGADRHLVELDMGALEALLGLGNDIAGFDLDLGAELLHGHARCMSTGRVPMAQPPGSDTLASPQRASSGPSTQKLARILDTSS